MSFWPVRLLQHQIVEPVGQRHVVLQPDQFARNARLVGIVDDRLPAFLLLDLAGAGKQRVEVAELFEKLRGGLLADARHARHVVDGIAHHRLQVDHLFGRHAPFLDDFGNADLTVLHRVVHRDCLADELHQILVGGDDGRVGARLAGLPRIGGDDVVGLETLHLDAGQAERAGGFPDQPELRNEVFRRRRAVRLVVGIKLVAEGFRRIVEDDREMARHHADIGVARVLHQLPHHVAEAEHRVGRQPVRFAVERRQGVIGAEDVAGAVDEEEMVAFFHGRRGSAQAVSVSIAKADDGHHS